MIVLDTNVVSQLVRPDGEPAVLVWLDRQDGRLLRTTAITVMEIQLGLELLAEGKRKSTLLERWAQVSGSSLFDDILTFDKTAAEIAAGLMARRSRRGITIAVPDTQIAAIAVARMAPIATHNIRHFDDLPIAAIDPWTA